MSILLAILTLGFIIFFHELGHFIAAKACGVAVLEFSVGMGPRLISGVYHNTRYSLKLLPLGGSCAMLDTDTADLFYPEDTSPDKVREQLLKAIDRLKAKARRPEDRKRVEDMQQNPDAYVIYEGVVYRKDGLEHFAFQKKNPWQRLIICLAGVGFNFLLAFLLSLVLIGVSGYDRLQVAALQENAPIAASGLQPGDEITSIEIVGGAKITVHAYRDVSLFMTLYADTFDDQTKLRITYVRDGETKRADFTPVYREDTGTYLLGIGFLSQRMQVQSVGELLRYSTYEISYNITATLESLKLMLRGQVERDEVMGPVGTVAVMGETVARSEEYGTINMLLVLANLCILLSANLGVMNLLPIPGLDGGRILFILAELLLRRRLNPALENTINGVAILLLLGLMLLILGNDIVNLLTGVYS